MKYFGKTCRSLPDAERVEMDETSAIVKTSANPPESWLRAGRYLTGIGGISSAISACVRTAILNNAPDAPRGVLDPASDFEINRFLQAPSIKIPFYFLSQARFSEEQRAQKYISGRDIMSLYNARELVSILSLIYVFKRIAKKLGEPEPDDWDRLSKTAQEHAEIGMTLGVTIPSLGFTDSMLVGGVRTLALGIFALKDAKGFKEYRRDLRIKDLTFNTAEEEKRWGCTHIEIASQILIQLGLGKEMASAFHTGLASPSDKNLTPEGIRMRIIAFWIESLHRGVSPPTIRGEEQYRGSQAALDQLFDQSSDIRKRGISLPWLSKGKKDISRDAQPQLFKSQSKQRTTPADDLEDGDAGDEQLRASDESNA